MGRHLQMAHERGAFSADDYSRRSQVRGLQRVLTRFLTLCYSSRCSMASTRVVDEKGLARYAMHPAPIAARRVPSLSEAVIKITGREWPMRFSWQATSMPDTFFRFMSSTTHIASFKRGLFRKSVTSLKPTV